MRSISTAELANAKRFGSFCPVYQVDATSIVKTGDSVRLTEAETMRYVRAHTNIPVPEVYASYKDADSGHNRIVMEFIDGAKLEAAWHRYTMTEKESVLDQLHQIFSELREVKGPFIGSVDNTACEDPIFDDDLGAYGPYEDEAKFNEGMVTALKTSQQGPWVDTVCNMVTTQLTSHETVLTHGDFAPRNILVRGAKVVAILDWELSGFFPAYWGYVKAMHGPSWESEFIKDKSVDRVLEP